MIENPYILTLEADEDLVKIYDFTYDEFGQNQAEKYLYLLEDIFILLSKTPNLGRIRNEIKLNLYSFPIKSHIVFYEIFEHQIIISRILHATMDLPYQFS